MDREELTDYFKDVVIYFFTEDRKIDYEDIDDPIKGYLTIISIELMTDIDKERQSTIFNLQGHIFNDQKDLFQFFSEKEITKFLTIQDSYP